MHVFILALFISFHGWTFDPKCQVEGAPTVTTQINEVAENLTNTCSFSELSKNRGGKALDDLINDTDATTSLETRARQLLYTIYPNISNEEMCECLARPSPLRDSLPDPEIEIAADFINRGVADIFREELSNLQGNVTKFKNLNLQGGLHETSKQLCSPQYIQEKILKLKSKLGSSDCQISEDEFNQKVGGVFSAMPNNIATELVNQPVELVGLDCMPRSTYARLRASNSYNVMGFSLFSNQTYFRQALAFDETENMASLLPYDLFFDLGYRNEDFLKKVHERVKYLDNQQNKNSAEIADMIYEDASIQDEAVKAIQRQCDDFTDNIERFICGGSNLKLEPKLTSVVASKTLGPDYADNHIMQAVVGYKTKTEACANTTSVSGHTKILNDYLEEREMQSYLAQGPFTQYDNSDYKNFNKLFCPVGSADPIDETNLSDLTKYFLTNKYAEYPSLRTFLENDAVVAQLGFRIDINSNPVIVPRSDEDDYPRMDRAIWKGMSESLRERGMSNMQIDQLFAILEMQTSSRRTELIAVRNRHREENPKAPSMTLVELDTILRAPPGTNVPVKGSSVPVNADLIQSVHRQQQTSRNERFSPIVNNNINQALDFSSPGNQNQATVAQAATAIAATETKVLDATSASNNVSVLAGAKSTVISPVLTTSVTAPTATVSTQVSKTETKQKQTKTSPSSSVDDNSTIASRNSRAFNPEAEKIQNDIKRIQEEIAQKQREYEDNNRTVQRLSNQAAAARITPVGPAQTTFRQNFNYPRNLPVRTETGQYYQPDSQGAELSSAAEDFSNAFSPRPQNSDNSNKSSGSKSSSQVAAGNAGGKVTGSGGGSGSSGANGAAASASRGPASTDRDEKLREDLNLPVYEFPRYIPQSMIDMIGSIEKVVLLLGLEGKQFKTIESIEEIDPENGKPRIRYYERIYDFVPGKKFSEFEASMKDKVQRAKIFETYFSYKRSPASLFKSRSYAKATKEVHKVEVEHNYVLENQNKILSEEEIRAKIAASMELLK